MKLYRLTPAGRDAFLEAIHAARVNGLYDGSWLDDPASTSIFVEAERPLPTLDPDDKLESVRRLHSWLSSEGLLTRPDIWEDSGFWSWLAARYWDVLTKRTKERIAPTEPASYVLLAGRGSYGTWRHKLAVPVRLYDRHGEHARVVLAGKLHTHGDMMEQVSAVKGILQNGAIMEVLERLYWDETKGDRARGAASKTRGSIRHLKDVLKQLELNWDLRWTDSDQLYGLLPGAFKSERRSSS